MTLERTTGGIRYPESAQREYEFNQNLKTAEILADYGFFVELQNKNKARNNQSWDAWLNGTDKVEIKNPLSSKSSTLQHTVLDGFDQAQSVAVTILNEEQMLALKKVISSDLSKKASNRIIKQMFVIHDGKMAQLSNHELLYNFEEVERKLDALF